MNDFLSKRPDIVIIIVFSLYLFSEHGHKPQVKAIFTALEFIVFIYIFKNVVYPTKNFYKDWIKKLNEIKFETTEETLRIVLGFLIFAYSSYYIINYLYQQSGQ